MNVELAQLKSQVHYSYWFEYVSCIASNSIHMIKTGQLQVPYSYIGSRFEMNRNSLFLFEFGIIHHGSFAKLLLLILSSVRLVMLEASGHSEASG